MMTMGKRNFMGGPAEKTEKQARSVCNKRVSFLHPPRIHPKWAPYKRGIEGNMAESTIWWLLAGILVAAELITGTFFLLMLAVGLAAAALAAHAGAGVTVQLLTAAVIGGGAVAVWSQVRRKRPSEPHAGANRDVNMDVGETVQVDAWNADGTASIKYRGANWTAVAGGPDHATGPHRVREVVGNRLVLEKI
jgi:membrane protein implicated in regulation of membrane protease activity